MKTIETDKGQLVLQRYERELPFTFSILGTLDGTRFDFWCNVYLDSRSRDLLKMQCFQYFHNFEHNKHNDGEEIFEENYGFNFNKRFGIKVNNFIYECKKFIKEDFKNEDDFIIYSFFGEIENIEVIRKNKKHNKIYFLIKDKVEQKFYELVIPEPDNTNFGGECFKLLTNNIDDAIEQFKGVNIVEKLIL